MAYPKITVNTTQAIHVTPSNTIPIPNPNFLAAIGTANFVTTGTTTNTATNKLIDAAATFQAANPPLPIIVGDVAYNITNTANAAITAVESGVQLNLASNAFQAVGNNEEYKIVRLSSLIDEEINFVNLGVKVGDIVVNTDNAGIATVTVVKNEDELILSTNIFGSLLTADDNFRIYSQQEGSEYYPAYLGSNGGSSTTTNNPGCLIYVGDTGVINTGADATSNQYKNVTVRTVSGEIISFKNFPVGDYLPVQVVQVMSGGTTANSLIGIW